MAASRYEPVSYGKNAPPWRQDLRHGNKKKHNYKEKSNKIPLRDQLRQAEAASLLEKTQRDAHIRANKMLAERRRQEEELKAAKKKPNSILKAGNGASNSGYVTLTQEQLSSILSTLSKVQGSSGEVNLDVDGKDHLKLTIEKPDSRESDQSITSSSQQLENILSLSKNVMTADTARYRESSREEKDRKGASDFTSKPRRGRQVVMNFNLGSGTNSEMNTDHLAQHSKGKKKLGTDKKRVKIADENYDDSQVFKRSPAKVVVIDDDTALANENTPTQPRANVEKHMMKDTNKQEIPGYVELSPRQRQLLIPRAHMSKGEKLRLQFELEAAAIDKLEKENKERAESLGLVIEDGTIKGKKDKTYHKEGHFNGNSTSLVKPDYVVDVKKSTVLVEPDFIPGLGNVSDRETFAHTELPPTNQSIVTKHPSQATEPSNVFLTKAELKRLQWNKEKAEAPVEYDPWGRPGAGVGPGAVNNKVQQHEKPAQQYPKKQQLTSQQQEEIYLQKEIYLQNMSSQQGPQAKESTAFDNNPLRAPFQEPTTSVPTSMLGIENPYREITKPAAPLTETLTKAQLLKLKWAEDKAASIQEYDPYGRPGAGAPIRSDSGTALTSYHSRQKQMMQNTMEHYQSEQTKQQPETSMLATEAYENARVKVVPTLDLNTMEDVPDISSDEAAARNHIRGQLVNLDPATLKEREELRRKELRYQEEIRLQVEEKEREKKEKRLMKLREEVEEEAKYKAETRNAQQEIKQMREMYKLKEAKEVSRVDLVAEAMQRAKQEAEILKAKRRLEKLQAAGHDITHLKAAYEEKFTPRVGANIADILTPRKEGGGASTIPADVLSPRAMNSQSRLPQHTVEPSSVPGLDLSPRANATRHTSRTDEGTGYTSNRILTPHKWHGTQKENLSPVKEFGVQTETPVPDESQLKSQNSPKKKTERSVKNKQVRVISGSKTSKAKDTQKPKPWGWKNQGGKRFTGQSKRDPRYAEQQEEKIVRSQARKEKLLMQAQIINKPKRVVEVNSKHYPDGKTTRASVDRDTVNSYLSPRYMLNDNISPRAHESISTTPRAKDNVSQALVSNNKQREAAKTKQETKTTRASGYELSIGDTLQLSPDDEYIPFRRSDAILSPSNAQDLSPMSREPTQAALAREAYYKNMQPAQYGVHMHNIKDTHQNVSSHNKDPLYNPSLLTKHPTDRQQQVLDSLRQMRQGLMAKQREIASVVTPEIPQDNQF